MRGMGGSGGESRIYVVYSLYIECPLGVVPVRLDDDELKRIDLLVQQKHYKSRNEAIRKMLKSKLSEELSEDEDVHELVGILMKLKKKGKNPLVLKLEKTAVETVAEGRARWPT
jgi:metal-responsive CopG/Arc/MetJ family transcriptional regulator